MATVTVALTGALHAGTIIQWPDNVSLGTTFDGGTPQFEQTLSEVRITNTGGVLIGLQLFNDRFTPEFETSGRFIFTSSDGMVLEVVGTGGDITEAYSWTPTNSDQVIAFYNHILTLDAGDARNATLTLTDDPPPPVTNTVTVGLTGYSDTSLTINWHDNVSLGSAFSRDGNEQVFDNLTLWYDFGALQGDVQLDIVGDNRRFTDAFEATGRIILTAHDGETVEFQIANAAMAETYEWRPVNWHALVNFANHVRSLSDHQAMMTLTDETDAIDLFPTAPTIADQTGQVGVAFSLVLDPPVGGDPPFHYTATPLPAGLMFDVATRTISGTPTDEETLSVVYTMIDHDGDVATTSFDFVVAAAAIPDTLIRDIYLEATAFTGIFVGDVPHSGYLGNMLFFGGSAAPPAPVPTNLWEQVTFHAHCATASRFTTHMGSQDIKYDTRPAGSNHAGTLLDEYWDEAIDINSLVMMREIRFFQNVDIGGPFRLFRSGGDNTAIGGLNFVSSGRWQNIWNPTTEPNGRGLSFRTFILLLDASGDDEYLVIRMSDLDNSLFGNTFLNPGTAVPAISTFTDVSEFNDWGSRVRQDLVGRELIWAMFRYPNDADIFDFTPDFT